MARVYVSSTFADLKGYRERVRDALRRRGHEDVAMERYGAQDERPLEQCVENVKGCDLYIGIFAWRYGHIPPGENRSITELEYRTAVDAGKRRLLFLLADDARWPVDRVEMEKSEEQKRLRVSVETDRVVGYFSSADQLDAELTDALVRWEQDQGIAGDSAESPPTTKTRIPRIPDIVWIEIPAGDFSYGGGEQRVHLDTFWITKYPITNLQFQTFVDDGGYREVRWWWDLRKSKPAESHWQQANRPRTDVDWYEAVAFTRWLTAQLGLAEGSIRLPTEPEWEKAARGQGGFIHPRGNAYRPRFANINETERKDSPRYLEQTTAVGMYPHGRSPYRVEDVSGTVWEWCLNKYDQPDAISADTSNDARALRGGSWMFNSAYARAVSRHGRHPDDRYGPWGFRVLSSVPIALR